MARSLDQIKQQIVKLQHEAAAIEAKERDAVIARIRSAIEHYDLTADELFAAGKPRGGRKAKTTVAKDGAAARRSAARKGGTVPIKYRDADGNQWSGRGSKPRWLVAALEAGKKLEDFLV